jgi:hypothetical protein
MNEKIKNKKGYSILIIVLAVGIIERFFSFKEVETW